MRTPIMDWEDYQSNNQIESEVQVFIRPPIAHWTKEPIPDLIHQEPIDLYDYCCCSYRSYGGGNFNYSAQPVPENTTTTMLGLGLFIILGIIYLKSINKIIK